jgi:hypothetical protein
MSNHLLSICIVNIGPPGVTHHVFLSSGTAAGERGVVDSGGDGGLVPGLAVGNDFRSATVQGDMDFQVPAPTKKRIGQEESVDLLVRIAEVENNRFH